MQKTVFPGCPAPAANINPGAIHASHGTPSEGNDAASINPAMRPIANLAKLMDPSRCNDARMSKRYRKTRTDTLKVKLGMTGQLCAATLASRQVVGILS